MKIDHAALYCVDLEGMKDFFITFFDARPGELYHNRKTGFRSYFLQFTEGGARLEICTRPEVEETHNGPYTPGYSHLSLSVGTLEQVDILTRRINQAGYPVLSGPRVTGDGYYESTIQGPEGILVEITV